MERRSFIQTAAFGAVLAAPAIVNAQTLPQIRWRLASSWPKNLGTIYCGAYTVAQRVSAATGGLFEISVHGSGEIVSALEVADAVQQGSVECAHTASVFFFGKDTTFALDGQIPFVMTSRQINGCGCTAAALRGCCASSIATTTSSTSPAATPVPRWGLVPQSRQGKSLSQLLGSVWSDHGVRQCEGLGVPAQ